MSLVKISSTNFGPVKTNLTPKLELSSQTNYTDQSTILH
jgi:hypothetical protein